MIRASNSYRQSQIRLVANAFLDLSVGEIVTHDRLKALLKLKEGSAYRSLVDGGKKLAMKEGRCWFRTHTRVGYERVHGGQTSIFLRNTRLSVRRRVNRDTTHGANVFSTLNNPSSEEMNTYLREQAALGLIKLATYDRNVPKPAARSDFVPSVQTASDTLARLKAMRGKE